MLVTEMVDEIVDQINDASIRTRAIRWLNIEQDLMAGQYRFPVLQKSASIATVAGTQNYLFSAFSPTITDLAEVKEIRIPSIPRKVYPIEENVLAISEPNWDTLRGSIFRYINRGKSVDLWRVPDGAYTLIMTYYRQFARVADTGASVCELQAPWHPYLIQRALVRGMRAQDHPRLTTEREILASMDRDFQASLYSTPDNMHVFQNPEYRYKKPWPTLPPDHFPRSR